MSDHDMPTFGQAEETKQKAETADDMPRPVTRDLPPETGLSVQDQKEAVAKVIKMFVILAAVLIGSVFLYKGVNFAWQKYNLSKVEESLQKIIDDKLIDAERAKYTKQYDDWVAQVQPDYEQYYPYKSDYEFQKIVGSHKFLMQTATTRLDFIEDQLKGVLKAPEKSEAQIREAMNFWAEWKDRDVTEAERQAADEERQVKQYFAQIKPKEEPKKELPPVEAAVAPPPAPAVKPAAAAPVQKQAAPVTKQPQESAADRRYLEELQKTMRTK